MRIATAHAYDTSIQNLQKRQQDLAESQMQLTSGKRVNSASDDPTAAARAERALASIARGEANKRSLDASRNVMSITESALGDTVDLVQTARETLVAAGNGTYSDGERKALAVKLREIRNQLLSVANRPDGGGGFVFGGQGSATPPFVDSTSGVKFIGQGGETLASSSEKLNLTVDGDLVWLKARSGNGVFTTAQGSNVNTGTANSGSGWITSGTVTAPSQLPYPTPSGGTSPEFSIQFHVSGGVTTYDVLDTTTSPTTVLSSGQPYASGKNIDIAGKGMAVSIAGAPADGDTFAIGESSNSLNIFTSLDNTIAALSQTNAPSSAIQQAINTGMTELDSVLGNIQAARSEVGESLNRMDGIESRIETLKQAAATEKSNAEDLDMTAAISNFQNRQTGYQAALQSYASVQKLSLFQYING
ncbi:MAG: flagellar hook-associated protein FlgL [Proteobacteria bacterium]|uniref:flagellar hook-associated protein FlgL n=1 Tax=Aquabacterium sp. TaxID=1872578 RepID=UPI0035C6C547|nr:flagellar hook-associated protein FlgL [Pseudomonadota bacterium]